MKAPARLLPGFGRWPGGLWAFSYKFTIYFASRDEVGRWRVVAREAEETPVGPGGKTKAAAVRAAMDTIDQAAKAADERGGA